MEDGRTHEERLAAAFNIYTRMFEDAVRHESEDDPMPAIKNIPIQEVEEPRFILVMNSARKKQVAVDRVRN